MNLHYFNINQVFSPEIFQPQKEFYLQRNENRKKTRCKVLTNFGDSLILISKTKGFKPFVININDVGHYKKFMFYSLSYRDVTNTFVEEAKWDIDKLSVGSSLLVQRYNDNIKDYNKPILFTIKKRTEFMLELESEKPKKRIFIKPYQAFSKKTFRLT